MKTRSFPKTWIHGTKSPLASFSELSQEIYEALNGIKRYYEDVFNKNSIISIDDYINEFNNAFEEFIEISTPYGFKENFIGSEDDKEYERNLKNWYDSDRFFTMDNNNYKTGLYDWTENDFTRVTTMRISEKFEADLLKQINKIFNIEEFTYPIVKAIWKQELKNNENIFKNDGQPFFALIKVLDDWRDKSISHATLGKRVATSASLITEKHLHTFHEGQAHIAITYDINDGLLASYHSDAFLHEDVIFSFGNLRDTKKSRTNDVNKIYESEENMAFATFGCKIYTPKHIMEETSNNSYNEVILDSRISEPNAVVLFTYNGVKPEKDYVIAKNLADKLNLPLRFVEKNYESFKESSLREPHNYNDRSM